MKIPSSIEVCDEEVAAILSWFKPDEWLHQDEFDRLSAEWRRAQRGKKNAIRGYTPDTILLPMNGDPNLAILQELQRAGIIHGQRAGWDAEGKGTIKYRLADAVEQ